MDYLTNELKIIHRDIKGENIFLVKEENRLRIKLGDFGHALNNESNMRRNFFGVGTLRWGVFEKLFSCLKFYKFINFKRLKFFRRRKLMQGFM